MPRSRAALYDRSAGKKTVSLTINADLTRRAEEAGINASQIAEEALAARLEQVVRDALAEGARADIAAYNAYIDEYGLFADAVRAHEQDETPNAGSI